MNFCRNCGAPMEENAPFCAQCGAPEGKPYTPAPVYVDPTDHTSEFDPADISENKVVAMAAYVLGIFGVIIALLAAPTSAYAAFHSRQALKLDILSALLAVVTLVLCWTVIVPMAAAVCALILLVVRIVCFFHVCSGKAKEAPIVSGLGFLK